MDIIRHEDIIGRWRDKTILITGATAGLGLETARALHRTGAHLFLPVRDLKRGEAAVQDIVRDAASDGDGGRIELLSLDLNSLASVRECAAEFLRRSGGRLNVLINNAGVMGTPEGRTADGFETQFGINHLAHFLLFLLLRPALLAASSPAFHSRVVCLTSSAHGRSRVLHDDSGMSTGYNASIAYAASKTATIYVATEIERRYGQQGLHGHAVHPGIIWTGLHQHTPADTIAAMRRDEKRNQLMKSREQGAATTVWAATARELEGKGGKYLEDCGVAEPRSEARGQYFGYVPYVYDTLEAKRLWDDSLRMVGVEEDEQRSS